jgi:hypothetical protein
MKYQKIPNFKNGSPCVSSIILTCSTDGRLRVFVNEKKPDHGRIYELEEEEYDEFEGVQEVPYLDSDYEDSESDHRLELLEGSGEVEDLRIGQAERLEKEGAGGRVQVA